MRAFAVAVFVAAVAAPGFAQQIYDIWQTTWDRDQSFTYTNLGSDPINFVTPGPIGQADIVVDDTSGFQSVWGHGGALTDSSASLLIYMKQNAASNYWSLLDYLFDPTDGGSGAGLSYIRVPLGASDFSATSYTYDDNAGDTSLNDFNINETPSEVFEILNDIQGINQYLKVHLLPWSPPGWMKDSGSINGGNFLDEYTQTYANYLLKCLQGFQSQGITAYAIGAQNEPENSDDTYPSCILTATQEAQVGTALRTLMDDNGFSNTRIIGYDHNWSDAGGYPIQLMEQAESAFAGVSFHCYEGSVTDQDTFHDAYPDKEIYFTECTGTMGTDWWSDIKWYMDNLYIGAVTHNAHAVLMWNLVLDPNGWPELPSSDSCRDPDCRGIVTMSGTSWTVNQEFYAMAQASKAIVPKDVGGDFGKRIGVTVNGDLDWALIVGAYVTPRVNPTDWLRYSLVVLNWDDSASTTWNPQPVTTTIEFRGMQASYTFPVGVTTLWWYAPPTSTSAQGVLQPAVNGTASQPIAVNATAPTAATASAPVSVSAHSVANGTAAPAFALPSFTASISFASASASASAASPTNATEKPALKIRGANTLFQL